ncbi:hypothetical protein NFI96_026350, partial [Prochilodus magdalenae]
MISDVGLVCGGSQETESRLIGGPHLCIPPLGEWRCFMNRPGTNGHTGARLVNGSDSCFWSSGAPSTSVSGAQLIFSVSSLALHEGRVRLSGGRKCNGEVEVYFRQDWEESSAGLREWACGLCGLQVQLGCALCSAFSSSSPSSPEHSHMCVTGFSTVLGVKLSSGELQQCTKRSTAALQRTAVHHLPQLTAPSGWLVLEETVQEGWRFSTAVHGGT